MARPDKSLTVLIHSKRKTPLKVSYTPEQVERMRLGKQVWDKTRSLGEVGRALGVSSERARQILDRGSAIGLYAKRRGASGWAVEVEPMEPARNHNLAQLLTGEVQRQARRVTRPLIAELQHELRRQRQIVASLRGEVAVLTRDCRTLMEDLHKRLAQPQAASPDELKHARLGPKSIHAQRHRLGLNKTEFALLLGVNALTVAHWESGQKPRAQARAALVAVRLLGRREARRRLDALAPSKSS